MNSLSTEINAFDPTNKIDALLNFRLVPESRINISIYYATNYYIPSYAINIGHFMFTGLYINPR